MKSKPPELNQIAKIPGISCEGCVFSINSEGVQTGCLANRLRKFMERGARKYYGEKSYRVPKLCNMYRDSKWRSGEDQTLDSLLGKAKYEAQPMFGIALRDDPQKPFSELEKSVESILKMDYDRDKIKTVISSFPGRGLSAVSHLVNLMQEAGHKNSSCIFHIMHQSKTKDTEIFKRLVQGHYFVNVQVGTLLDPGLFNLIDDSLNNKLESIYLFEGDGFSVAPKSIVTKMYLDFNNYDKMINHLMTTIIQSRDRHSSEGYVYL